MSKLTSPLKKLYKSKFLKKHYTHSDDYRSETEEDGRYLSVVKQIISNQNVFDQFRRNRVIIRCYEHVTFDAGRHYLDIIRRRNSDAIPEAMEHIIKSDNVGQPIKHKYDALGLEASATTLRYLKVSSDLAGLFGEDMNGAHVAEIGCGFGAQAFINDQLLGVAKTTLFDLPLVNELIKRYLNTRPLNGAFEAKAINEVQKNDYDLVISNYAISELPRKLQEVYIRKVVSSSKRGYLTMNSGLRKIDAPHRLLLDEYKKLIPAFSVYDESPKTGPNNYMIVWGHNEEFASKEFEELSI